jgi:hypothetical protein
MTVAGQLDESSILMPCETLYIADARINSWNDQTRFVSPAATNVKSGAEILGRRNQVRALGGPGRFPAQGSHRPVRARIRATFCLPGSWQGHLVRANGESRELQCRGRRIRASSLIASSRFPKQAALTAGRCYVGGGGLISRVRAFAGVLTHVQSLHRRMLGIPQDCYF